MNGKKAALLIVALLILGFVITFPKQAADMTRDAGDWLGDAAESLWTFTSALFS